GGLVLPSVVLLMLFAMLALWARAERASAQTPALRIEVIAHDWWWEVRYPDSGVTTANTVHLPVGVAVEVVGTSADAIHTFWGPQLGGEIDFIPGRNNQVMWRADAPLDTRGQCAEFCGVEHARMAFDVVAEPPDAFAAWLRAQGADAVSSSDPIVTRGQAV